MTGSSAVVSLDPKDAVIFEVCCKVNFKRQFAFHLFYLRNFRKPVTILLVLGALLCAINFTAFNLTLLFFTAALIPAAAVIASVKELILCKNIPDRYIFYPGQIENTDRRGKNFVNEERIRSVYETSGFFYINIGERIYCIIDKDCFIVGNAADMRKYHSGIPNVEYRKFCK